MWVDVDFYAGMESCTVDWFLKLGKNGEPKIVTARNKKVGLRATVDSNFLKCTKFSLGRTQPISLSTVNQLHGFEF